MFLTATVIAHLLLLLPVLPFAGVRNLLLPVLALYAGYHLLIAWAIVHPRSRFFGPNRSRLATRERVVALTFDDGPHPEVTPRILDILRNRGVPATFFLIGRFAERHPELVRRIVAEGHAVESHSHTHSYLFWAWTPRRIEAELDAAQRAIGAAAGEACRRFRAPVGLKNCFLHRALRRRDLELVSWDVRFLDRRPVQRRRIERRLRRAVVPGSILLMHDGHDRDPAGRPQSAEALPLVLDILAEQGYRCVPLGARA